MADLLTSCPDGSDRPGLPRALHPLSMDINTNLTVEFNFKNNYSTNQLKRIICNFHSPGLVGLVFYKLIFIYYIIDGG